MVRTSVTHSAAPRVHFLFLPHFDVICDLLVNKRTATWNVFVNYNIASKVKQFHPRNVLTSSVCFIILWVHDDDEMKPLKCLSVSFQWVWTH